MPNMHSSSLPTLTTERLTLRQLSLDDKQNIFDLRSDTNVNKYLERQPCTTIEDALNFINKINENIEKGDTYYWAIVLTGTNTLVGTICLFDLSVENKSCEIGYELLTKYQGQGMMREATEKVIDYVFHTLQIQKIIAFTHSQNKNSLNLLTKLEFVLSEEVDKENPNFNIFTLNNYY